MTSSYQFSFQKFMSSSCINCFSGPVAMNLLTATGDPYGAQGMSAFLYMCPNFIAQSKFV